MSRAIILTGVAIAAVSAGVAMASPMGKGDGRMGQRMNFEQMDSDNDGRVTRAEVEAAAAARFAAMDTDGDGAISADEMAAAAAAGAEARARDQHARMLQWRDSDGDGKLSAAEMGTDRVARMFERMDADGDGAISKDEAERMQSRMQRHADRANRGEGHGRMQGKGHGQD